MKLRTLSVRCRVRKDVTTKFGEFAAIDCARKSKMKKVICTAGMLLNAIGIVTSVAANENALETAEKRGLSPIATLKPDYLFKVCSEISNSSPRSVDPAGRLAVYLGNKSNRDLLNNPTALASIKTTLMEGTMHGKLISPSYMYNPDPDYLGTDKAVFMAEFEGKKYKIVVEIKVLIVIDQNSSQCDKPKLIKVNGKPVSGSSDYNLGNITVTFADLPSGAVGQTVGNNITLDTNAAGNNWFIDTTPADNSEFLPTANPNEWVAKAGSAAAGKMDMLSVLLHEYGHALGIEHSLDSGDYMGTTLTVGVRRLPSATELALMQNLIAQAKGDSPSLSRGGLGRGWGDTSAQDPTHPHPALPLEGEEIVGQSLPGNAPTPMPLPIPLGAVFGMAFIGRLRKSTFGGTSIDVVGAPSITHWVTSQAPDDAFEGALLDANTGLSVLGNDGSFPR